MYRKYLIDIQMYGKCTMIRCTVDLGFSPERLGTRHIGASIRGPQQYHGRMGLSMLPDTSVPRTNVRLIVVDFPDCKESLTSFKYFFLPNYDCRRMWKTLCDIAILLGFFLCNYGWKRMLWKPLCGVAFLLGFFLCNYGWKRMLWKPFSGVAILLGFVSVNLMFEKAVNYGNRYFSEISNFNLPGTSFPTEVFYFFMKACILLIPQLT